jgi:hypothetical protein
MFSTKSKIFVEGDSTDGQFYVQKGKGKGKGKVSVVSEGGQEATVSILGESDYSRAR